MAKPRKRIWSLRDGSERVAWIVDLVDQTGERIRRQFPTRREADAFRIKTESEIANGLHRGDAQRTTIGEAAASYVEYIRRRMMRNERMSPHNFETYCGHIQNHILNVSYGLGKIKLAELSRGSVEDFRDRLRSPVVADLSAATTRKVLSTLKLIVRHAESRGWTSQNPVNNIEVIAPRELASKKIEPPSKATVSRLLKESLSDPWFWMLIRFATLTGVRASEQRALCWRHVDFDKRCVKIRQTLERSSELRPPKTNAGERDIPLSEALMGELKAFRLASRCSRDDDWVFAIENGRPYDHDNMSTRKFRPLRTACDAENVRWHDFRHFAISTWIEAGMTPKQVQTYAGHADLSTTMNRYGHLFPSPEHHAFFDAVVQDLNKYS